MYCCFSKRKTSQSTQPSVYLASPTGLLWISHLSTRYIPRQGSYTCNQAHAAAQHSHGIKKLSGISKYRRPFPSKPSCYGRANTKDHTQRLFMVMGPRAIWSLKNKLHDLISSDTVLDWDQWHLDSEAPGWFYPAYCICKPQSLTHWTALQPNWKGSIIRSMGMWEVSFYIHVSQFDLVGDHKPLEVLLNGRGNPSPRIERWQLRLQIYSPRIVYHPGIQNAVDFLSCKPVTTNTTRDPVEDYVNSIVVDSLPSAITLQELLLASKSDPTLITVKECLDTGNWSAAQAPFSGLKERLCQKRGFILQNSRIVICDTLRLCILQLAHEGH